MENQNDFKRAPVNLLSILLSAAMLFSAQAALGDYSPHIQSARPLTPPGSKIIAALPETSMARQIDEAVIEIFTTKTGKAFCGAVTENIVDFHRAFFVHRYSAEKAFSLCKDGNFFSKTPPPYRLFEKKYIVALTDRMDFPADGWTTPRNETILFISNSEMGRERLIRSIAHELAVSLDRKELLGFGGVVDPAFLGVTPDFTACAVTSVIRSVQLKHTLSGIRAFEIEKRIANELGISLPENFASSQRTCGDRIQHLSKYTASFAQSYASEDLVNQLFDVPSCQGALPPGMSLSAKVDVLVKSTLTFKDGTQRNACEYLTEGWPFYPGASFRGGPGSRMAGGGW